MRMTEGDHIQLLFINSKDSKHDHSIHMHSIHAGDMDGMMGPGGSVAPGKSLPIHLLQHHLDYIHIIVMLNLLMSTLTKDYME